MHKGHLRASIIKILQTLRTIDFTSHHFYHTTSPLTQSSKHVPIQLLKTHYHSAIRIYLETNPRATDDKLARMINFYDVFNDKCTIKMLREPQRLEMTKIYIFSVICHLHLSCDSRRR